MCRTSSTLFRTEVAPAAGEGVGGADDVGAEHAGAPELAAHEAGEREADRTAGNDERRRVRHHGHAEHCEARSAAINLVHECERVANV